MLVLLWSFLSLLKKLDNEVQDMCDGPVDRFFKPGSFPWETSGKQAKRVRKESVK